LVARGPLEELRAGVEAQAATGVPAAAAEGATQSGHEKLTLEQVFLRTVGDLRRADQEPSWLGGVSRRKRAGNSPQLHGSAGSTWSTPVTRCVDVCGCAAGSVC